MGAIQNTRKCVYPFVPDLPKIKTEAVLAAGAYPLVSLLKEFTCVPLGYSVAHFPAVQLPAPITHIRGASFYPMFAAATTEMKIYLIFSVFKLAGPHVLNALEYSIFEKIEEPGSEKTSSQIAPSQGDSGA